MNSVKVAVCFALFWMLSGCATHPTREELERPEKAEQLVLAERVSIVAHSPIGVRWEYVALPGAYRAEGKDSRGVYFFGADRSIVVISELYKNELRLKIGGIYLPNEPTELPHFFYVFETDVYTTESIEKYVDQRNAAAIFAPGSSGVSGSTVVGNIVGGAIVSAIIAAGVGKITTVAATPDASVGSTIRASRKPGPANVDGGQAN